MKNSKRNTAILTAAILVSLMATSIVFAGAYTLVLNPKVGTLVNNAPYSSSSNSANALAALRGNLLQYEWAEPLANGGESTGSYDGPAPDRADVAYVTSALVGTPVPKVILSNVALSSPAQVVNPFIVSFSGAVMGIDGQLFASATIRVNASVGNTTTRSALVSMNPFTGACNWAYILGLGMTGSGNGTGHLSSSTSIGSDMASASYIYKVDSKHIAVLGGGLTMFRTDGTFCWHDDKINPGAVYHSAVLEAAPEYKIFGPFSPGSAGLPLGSATSRVSYLGCWDLSDPETDKNVYNTTTYIPNLTVDKVQLSSGRSLWNYTIDEPGSSPIMCYGNGNVYMGSYSSATVYAVNATTGVKMWEHLMPCDTGYRGCFAEGKLFVGCQSCYETALNGTTGDIVWQNNDGLTNRGFNVWSVNYWDGKVYYHDLGASRSGAEKCYDATTGKRIWSSGEYELIGYYQTVVGGGKIYGTQSDGSMTTGREPDPVSFSCWDALTGNTLWELKLNIANPTLCYGSLYFIGSGHYNSSQLWCISTAFTPADWNMWRGNVDNPGYTASAGPINLNVGPKWTYQTGGGVISSPAISKGRLYINSNDKNVYCLDAYNGSLIWKFALDDKNVDLMTKFSSTPAVVGNEVIIGPDDGFMYCLDATTGAKLWTYDMEPAGYVAMDVSLGQFCVRPSPMIYNNLIYCGSAHSNTTYCLNLDGTLKWSFLTGGPIISSVAIENGIVYQMTWGRASLTGGVPGVSWGDANNCYELDAATGKIQNNSALNTGQNGIVNFKGNFSVATSFSRTEGGAFGASFTFSPSYTPVVIAQNYGLSTLYKYTPILYIGSQTACMAAYNCTDGSLIFYAEQPYVQGENSCGSPTFVPDNYGGKIYCQAGPAMDCINASLVPTNNSTKRVPINQTLYSAQQTGQLLSNGTYVQGNSYTNLWSAWGGWEIWSSVIYSGFGGNASTYVYSGSQSYSVTCWNASNGAPISWYTNGGPCPGSCALWDGKLYYGSEDGKVYMFEDHKDQPMSISIALDKTTVDMNSSESVTATIGLSAINTESNDLSGNPITYNPPFPNASILVTFTDPNGKDTNVTATTDANGMATVTFTPNVKGTWKAIAWYLGKDLATTSYGYCWSDQPTIEATQTITQPNTPVTPKNDYTMYYYAAAIVVVIVIVAAAALLLMRRPKK